MARSGSDLLQQAAKALRTGAVNDVYSLTGQAYADLDGVFDILENN